jgi:hypothetical protein
MEREYKHWLFLSRVTFFFEFFRYMFFVVCLEYYLLPKTIILQQLMHLVAFFSSDGHFLDIFIAKANENIEMLQPHILR